MKNWKNKPPLVLSDKSGTRYSVGQNVQWYSIPKDQSKHSPQLRKGTIKRIYPDGWLLILGRRGKTRIDPTSIDICVAEDQTPRFLHGDKVKHMTKGFGIFIHYTSPKQDQAFVSFGPISTVKQTDKGEIVNSIDLSFFPVLHSNGST